MLYFTIGFWIQVVLGALVLIAWLPMMLANFQLWKQVARISWIAQETPRLNLFLWATSILTWPISIAWPIVNLVRLYVFMTAEQRLAYLTQKREAAQVRLQEAGIL